MFRIFKKPSKDTISAKLAEDLSKKHEEIKDILNITGTELDSIAASLIDIDAAFEERFFLSNIHRIVLRLMQVNRAQTLSNNIYRTDSAVKK